MVEAVDDNGPRKNISRNVKYVSKFATRNSGNWWNILERIAFTFARFLLSKMPNLFWL